MTIRYEVFEGCMERVVCKSMEDLWSYVAFCVLMFDDGSSPAEASDDEFDF